MQLFRHNIQTRGPLHWECFRAWAGGGRWASDGVVGRLTAVREAGVPPAWM